MLRVVIFGVYVSRILAVGIDVEGSPHTTRMIRHYDAGVVVTQTAEVKREVTGFFDWCGVCISPRPEIECDTYKVQYLQWYVENGSELPAAIMNASQNREHEFPCMGLCQQITAEEQSWLHAIIEVILYETAFPLSRQMIRRG